MPGTALGTGYWSEQDKVFTSVIPGGELDNTEVKKHHTCQVQGISGEGVRDLSAAEI